MITNKELRHLLFFGYNVHSVFIDLLKSKKPKPIAVTYKPSGQTLQITIQRQ